MHLASNIKGILNLNSNTLDLIRDIIPGVTTVVCFKVRCVDVIEELKRMQRNLCDGLCDYVDWRGNLDLNISSRALLLISSAFKAVGKRGDGENWVSSPNLHQQWWVSTLPVSFMNLCTKSTQNLKS